jgi:N-acetylglucosamine-6-phosphate deacetylase
MIALVGADLVLPDRIVSGHALVISHGVIEAIVPVDRAPALTARIVDLSGCLVAPGFIDVHIHGLHGVDVLDSPDAVSAVARILPRYGVTAWCPTSVACTPELLHTLLQATQAERRSPAAHASRVAGAHLESNFINPDWKGAQPAGCLKTWHASPSADAAFRADDVWRVIDAHREDVAIVTLAPELPGGLDLVRALAQKGIRVSIGHSGATYDEAMEAIGAGVRHATHLFNRMSSLTSRSPGVVGAVLGSDSVSAEIICDGHHVHPSLIRLAVRAKSIARVMAITDATAAAGMPTGTRARLGEQSITTGAHTAVLDDGTLAGSILTMDAAFRMLIQLGFTVPEVSRLCATTAAESLGLHDTGVIAEGRRADLVVLDRRYRVRQTYLAGVPALEP